MTDQEKRELFRDIKEELNLTHKGFATLLGLHPKAASSFDRMSPTGKVKLSDRVLMTANYLLLWYRLTGGKLPTREELINGSFPSAVKFPIQLSKPKPIRK